MISIPLFGPKSAPKKTYRVDRDLTRRYSVILRHEKWQALRTDPHHLGVVQGMGPLSPMGDMTYAAMLGAFPTDNDAIRMIAFHYDVDESEGFTDGA